MKYGSVKIIRRIELFGIEEGIRMIAENSQDAVFNQDRIMCFIEKGTTCSSCKTKANTFSLEIIESSSYKGMAFNMYFNSNDKMTFFTKDHIIPKSKGGPCDMDNYQTMCWPCNRKKSDNVFTA